MPTYIKPIGEHTKEVIEFLNEVRESQGISYKELARMFNVYPTAVHNWFDTNKNPQLDSIVNLGNALGVAFSMSNTRKYVDSAEQLVNLLNKAKDYNEFSTRDLAEMTGITQPSISGILSHRIMPRLNAFLLIAEALGIYLELYPPE